jgi:DNA uptake protein ComE-like DNA-binding protein
MMSAVEQVILIVNYKIMKRINLFLILGLSLLSAVFTACSSEDETTGNAQGAKTHVTLGASLSGDDAATRTELTDLGAGSGIKVTWSASDAIKIIDASASYSSATFNKTSIGATTAATFDGEMYSLGDNHLLYAVYPSSLTNTNAAVPVNYATQGGTLAQVQRQAVMYAVANYDATGTALKFKNATCVMRVNVKLPVNTATVSTVTMTTPDNSLVNSATMTMSQDGSVAWSNKTYGDIVATYTGGLDITSGSFTAYLAVIPQTLSSGFAIRVKTTDGNIYQYAYSGVSDFSTVSKTININKNYATTFTRIPNVGEFMYADGSCGSSGTGAIGIVFSNKVSVKDFKNGYTHGYVLALKNAASGVAWANGGFYNTDSPDLQNNNTLALWESDLDGLTETNQLKSYGISYYPAAQAAINYKNVIAAPRVSSGWYLPSSGQWFQVISNLCGISGNITTYSDSYGPGWYYAGKSGIAATALNNAMSAAGSGNYDAVSISASTYGDVFWCSSEFSAVSSCYVHFFYVGNLLLVRYPKTDNDGCTNARAVLAF